jgi:hypothetical protein
MMVNFNLFASLHPQEKGKTTQKIGKLLINPNENKLCATGGVGGGVGCLERSLF